MEETSLSTLRRLLTAEASHATSRVKAGLVQTSLIVTTAGISAGFGLAAAWLALSAVMAPVQAALLIAVIFAALAIMIAVTAGVVRRAVRRELDGSRQVPASVMISPDISVHVPVMGAIALGVISALVSRE